MMYGPERNGKNINFFITGIFLSAYIMATFFVSLGNIEVCIPFFSLSFDLFWMHLIQ